MSTTAVSDSACLIGLERIGRTEILAESFDTIFIPRAVQEEIGYTAEWLTVKSVQNLAMVRVLRTQIDAGESEAIALATELEDVVVILDDKKARRVAHQLGLRITGTIGVILRAKKQGIVENVKSVLDALNAVDFRISNQLYQRAMELANED